jgi:16S rRNA (guanine527-N7)-methyltransferase
VAGLSANVEERLGSLAREYGLEPAGRAALARYLELLATDPTAPTAIADPERGVDLHVADSLSGLAVAELAAAPTVADLGAGAGAPGLVLAAARPAAKVFLVESSSRKCGFLHGAVEAMGLDNAEVVCARAESWDAGLGACAAVTARALAPLNVLVEYAAPLLRPAGALVAWKGAAEAEEQADGDHAAATLGLSAARTVPVTPYPGSQAHKLYVYLRVGSLPNGYPRRPGMARKRPLRASTRA